MIERGKKYNKRSAIINISSGSAQSELSYQSHYCATKSFDDMLARSIQVEYRNTPIDFLCVRPYLVTSTMTRNQTSIFHVTTDKCAEGAIKDLGRYNISYGHFNHRVQGVIID